LSRAEALFSAQMDSMTVKAEAPGGRKPGLFARFAKGFAKSPRRVPDGLRIYAVGDIHGCVTQLQALLDAVVDDGRHWEGAKHIVFLGDYCDRGPDSKGVIERLLAGVAGFEATYLRGNHDQAVLDFLQDPLVYRNWRAYGAPETLLSYGVIPPRFDDEAAFLTARDQFAAALPASHLRFLQNLQYFSKIGDYFFVHAGVRPGVQLEKQVPEDLLWIRDEFLMSNADFGAVVVHGHTPGDQPVRRTNRICVDTGVYATGRLTTAVLQGEDCRFLAV